MTSNDLRNFLTDTDFALSSLAQSRSYSQEPPESVHYLTIAKSVRENTIGG